MTGSGITSLSSNVISSNQKSHIIKSLKKHQEESDVSWKCDLGDGKYHVSALHHVLEDKDTMDNGMFS